MGEREESLRRILQEFVDRRARGEEPSAEEILERHPEHRDALREHFSVLEALDRLVKGKTSVPPEATVLGDFRILREVGRGGMGVVFLAEQTSLHRLVALKVLGAPLAQSYRSLERFRREAEIAARLRHPNLVAVYATGESGGYSYFAMEYVRGITLARLLVHLRERGAGDLAHADLLRTIRELTPVLDDGEEGEEGTPEPVPYRAQGYFGAVARIVAELADGLAYAHARGVTHRDVKPQNILLGARCAPQLADFGLAKELGLESLSVSGDLVGTPFYMSPEIAMAGRIEVDHRTDIYSLGVTMYEMLTLALPFTGRSSQEVLRRILLEPPVSPRRVNPAVPRDLQVIALKAMEKDPDHRFAAAAEMAEDLRRFLRFEPIHARPPGPVTVTTRWVKRHRWAAAATAVVLVGGALGFAALRAEGARARLDARLESAGRSFEAGEWTAAGQQYASVLEDHGRNTRARRGLEEVERRIEAEVADLLRRARAHLDGEEYVHAIPLLERARDLGDRDEIGALLDVAMGLFPVEITSDPTGARVTLHPVDGGTGAILEGREIGSTPVRADRLPLGTYRVLVEEPGFGFGEYSIEVRRGADPLSLHARLRPTDRVVEGMILVPGGTYPVGIERSPGLGTPHELFPRTVRVEPFYIDRGEVTADEYARFVEETGRTPPKTWRDGEPPDTDLAVAGVSWYDALAFAEWVGKRLPTEVEWEIACRGEDARLWPWGNEYVEGNANVGPPIPVGEGTRYSERRGAPRAAGSTPGDRSPFGVFDLSGNLREWTWEPWVPGAVRPGERSPEPPRGRRVVRGGSYSQPDIAADCVSRRPFGAEETVRDFGFRCAKSVRP